MLRRIYARLVRYSVRIVEDLTLVVSSIATTDALADCCVRRKSLCAARRLAVRRDRQPIRQALNVCNMLDMTYRDAEKAHLITTVHAALLRDYLDQPYLDMVAAAPAYSDKNGIYSPTY
jgi:hypothetical protein